MNLWLCKQPANYAVLILIIGESSQKRCVIEN